MTDSTHAPRDRRRRACRALIACLLAASWGLSGPTAALGDGDPASDVLATQNLFLPQDAAVPLPRQTQLEAVVQEAARAGYQIRVAVIASPTDLGSIGELWEQPASYARFLGQELSLTYRGTLLVVMPDGFGLFEAGRSTAQDQAALAGFTPRGGRTELAVSALTGVRQLAAAHGHPVPVPAAGTRTTAAAGDTTQWVAFGIGFGVIALAWAASLRDRPLRLRRRHVEAA